MSETGAWKKYLPLGIIVALALFLYLFRLGGFPLYDYDEATYGGIAVATLQSHAFFTLHSLIGPWFEKPPLYIWSIMASIKTFGVSEWSIRLPSALCGVGAIALIYLLVLEITDDIPAAVFAAAALLTIPLFYFEGRQSRMDIPVIAAILFTLLAFVKGTKNKKWFLLMGIELAAAVMIKSVIGLLVGIPIILFALLFKEWDWIKAKYFWAGLGVGLLLLLPWHLYEIFKFGNGFWSIYFTQQVFSRAVVGMGSGVTTATYLKLLWYQFIPWTQITILLIPLFYWMEHDDKRTKLAKLGLGTAIIYFLLFAAARTKLGEYLLPLYPFAAIFVAAGLSSLKDVSSSTLWRGAWLAAIAIIFSMGLYFTLKVQFVDFDRWYPFVYDEQAVGELIAQAPPTMPVYDYNALNLPTMLFYGEKQITALPLDASQQSSSFLLVAPRQSAPALLKTPRYAQADLVYNGNVYLLLLIPPPTHTENSPR